MNVRETAVSSVRDTAVSSAGRLSATGAPLQTSRPLGGVSKRAFDIVAASLLLIAAAPIMLVVMAVMWTTECGPIFFGHSRLGYRGRTFRCWKFRTMVTNSAEVLSELLASDPAAAREWAEGQKLKNDPRVTAFGAVMRKLSIDELPQLVNVLLGEMSLVGPRPIVAAEVDRYGAKFVCYQVARPGITGLWQIRGRSDCSYAERIGFDMQYATQWSFAGDIVILLKTSSVVMLRKGSC